jgi:hypothetical protein
MGKSSASVARKAAFQWPFFAVAECVKNVTLIVGLPLVNARELPLQSEQLKVSFRSPWMRLWTKRLGFACTPRKKKCVGRVLQETAHRSGFWIQIENIFMDAEELG